jgi:hypothetical protein
VGINGLALYIILLMPNRGHAGPCGRQQSERTGVEKISRGKRNAGDKALRSFRRPADATSRTLQPS